MPNAPLILVALQPAGGNLYFTCYPYCVNTLYAYRYDGISAGSPGGISAVSDTTTGDVHLLSGESGSKLDFRTFSGSSWAPATNMSSASSSCPSLSYDESNSSFYAYWLEGGLAKRRSSTAGVWDAVTPITTSGTASCLVSDAYKAGGTVKVFLNDTTTTPQVQLKADTN